MRFTAIIVIIHVNMCGYSCPIATREQDQLQRRQGHGTMEKHVELTIEEKRFRYTCDEASIAHEAALEDMVADRISLQGSAEKIVCQYK